MKRKHKIAIGGLILAIAVGFGFDGGEEKAFGVLLALCGTAHAYKLAQVEELINQTPPELMEMYSCYQVPQGDSITELYADAKDKHVDNLHNPACVITFRVNLAGEPLSYVGL